MKVAINVQNDEWEDDGGAHDPFVIDLDSLKQLDPGLAQIMIDAVSDSENMPLLSLKQVDTLGSQAIRVQPPCVIDAVFPVWWS